MKILFNYFFYTQHFVITFTYKTATDIKTLQHNNDPQLIALWQKGDLKAFDCLYERYVFYLTNLAIKKTANLDTAKECVQDVFISLYHRKDELKTTSCLKAYLYTALQHKIYNQFQKELTRLKYESIAMKNQAIAAVDLSQQYETKILAQQIQEKIQALPTQCRKVFLMSREEGLTYRKIAEQLNISVNTVDQHIQRALKILRASLEKVVLIMVFVKTILQD